MISNTTPLQDPAVLALKKEKYGSQVSDDEPLYDSVASDDDYAAVTTDVSSIRSTNVENEKALAPMAKGLPSIVEVLKKQLSTSESTIKSLQEEMKDLKKTIEALTRENRELKSTIQSQKKSLPEDVMNGHSGEQEPVLESLGDLRSTLSRGQRPASMYETREGLKKPGPWNSMSQTKPHGETLVRPNTTQSLWSYQSSSLPSCDEVTRRTEQVTRRIQELWMAMQDPGHREAFVPCAERIRVAVAELTAIFPQVFTDSTDQSLLFSNSRR
uniref:GIT2_0 protein n=1 Tax=Fopius arisanus TaxID=64838 RepID=A0A0C9RS72_9HYME